MALSDYLNGQKLLVASAFNGVVMVYDPATNIWSQSQAGGSMGIATGQTPVVMTSTGYQYYRQDGSLGTTVNGDNIHAHEMVYDSDGKLWICDTFGSRLVTMDMMGNYTELWRMPGVDESTDDRCHLNGVATENGKVRYVSALGISNKPNGWRDLKMPHGVILDITNSKVINDQLYAPHSPRAWQGKLYCTESNTGSLVSIDPATGKKNTLFSEGGFLRGLAFQDHYALVGQSQWRITNPQLPSDDPTKSAPGIYVIDLNNNQKIWFEPVDVNEVFDVQLSDIALQ